MELCLETYIIVLEYGTFIFGGYRLHGQTRLHTPHSMSLITSYQRELDLYLQAAKEHTSSAAANGTW